RLASKELAVVPEREGAGVHVVMRTDILAAEAGEEGGAAPGAPTERHLRSGYLVVKGQLRRTGGDDRTRNVSRRPDLVDLRLDRVQPRLRKSRGLRIHAIGDLKHELAVVAA